MITLSTLKVNGSQARTFISKQRGVEDYGRIKLDSMKYKIPVVRHSKKMVVTSEPPIFFVKTGTEDKDENYRLMDKEDILKAYSVIK